MKKILIILLLSVGCLSRAAAISVVSGTCNGLGNTVHFYEVENGQLKEKADYVLSTDKKFGFALHLDKEGYYVIGSANGLLPMGKYTFYLKPGDNLSVNVDVAGYELIGQNTAENKVMKEWFDIIKPINQMSMNAKIGGLLTYVEFFPTLDEVVEKSKEWSFTPTGNKLFDDSFLKFKDYDLAANALHFLFLPRTAHPQDEDFPEYYQEISFSNLGTSNVLMNYPFSNRLLSNIDMRRYMEKKKADTTLSFGDYTMLRENLSNISDGVLKGELVLIYAKPKQTVEGLLNFQSEFSKYLITESQKERFKLLLNEKAKNTKGEPAIDFKFQNSEGKEVALSDFKGKVVYIDVWATWCGPCKQEIPHLIKMEEEYKNKNIVFLGVSIDAQEDHAKWKKFLIDYNMKGVQVFAGDKAADISKPYKIKGIPRFILIDKNGRIVSDNAPRPSSSEIKLLLNSTLLH